MAKPIVTSDVCARKVAHPTKAAAKMAARVLVSQGQRGIRTFRCPVCKKWHNGHSGAWR